MKALRNTAEGLQLRDIEFLPNTGEAVIKVLKSGICKTDIEITRGYADFYGTLGHEFVGIVEESKNPELIGARIVGEINAGCGKCILCKSGDTRHCPGRTVLGIHSRDGAHAEYLCLPEENLFLVPENISDVEAVFIEPFAAALGIFDSYRFEPGLRLAVIGDGRLGLLCAFASRARGFCPVLIGHNKDKMQIAKNRGIETLLENEASVLYASCDVVIEASGSVSGFNLAAEISRPRGTIILKSTLSGQIQWPATKVVVNELRVLGSRCGRFAPAIDLLTNINLNLQELVTDVIPLSRGIEAFKIAENKNSLKVILDTTS